MRTSGISDEKRREEQVSIKKALSKCGAFIIIVSEVQEKEYDNGQTGQAFGAGTEEC